MDFLTSLLAWIVSLLSLIASVIWWIVSYLLWGLIWLLLPLAIVAFIALRAAEKMMGREAVRAWVKARAMRYGAGTWTRVRPWLFAFTAAPIRVLLWFIVFAIWHALVSLLWKPRWTPWQRAWGKRWKDAAAVRRKSVR